MAYRCLNHPERDAVGVCVKCRKYVCVECATRIAGVNYCADCLPRAERRESKRERSWERPAAVLVTVASFLFCSLLLGTCAVILPQASSESPEVLADENFDWMETVVEALFAFEDDCGRFPTDEEGLEALVEFEGGRTYLESARGNRWSGVEDVYGRPLDYRSSGLEYPLVLSAGRNGYFDTEIEQLGEGEDAVGDDEIFWVR